MKDAPTSGGDAASRWRALAVRAARKTLWMLLVLWGITLVSFFVIHLAPGTPTDMQTSLNPLAGDMVRERLNALYGLDRPLWEQYVDWLSRIVRLDFGISLSSDARPVMEKIMERMPLTVGMNVISLLLTLLVSIPIGIVSAVRRGSLHGITLDAGPIPDLIPVVSCLAALCEGETRVENAARLRLKESDRLQTTAALLSALGGSVRELPDGLVISGRARLSGGTADACGDHRIAMSAAMAACGCEGPVTVLGSECVAKSYPAFWEGFASLREDAV